MRTADGERSHDSGRAPIALSNCLPKVDRIAVLLLTKQIVAPREYGDETYSLGTLSNQFLYLCAQ
jgi:hypothetical protein